MKNINAYNEIEFKKEFSLTDMYKKIEDYSDIITWTILEPTHQTIIFHKLTPREMRGKRIISCVPFYYINMIDTGEPIYDIGTGGNLYSKFYPNVIGLDGSAPEGHVDDNYVSEHCESFENIMSMNALHFIPLADLAKRIDDVISMTQPGGKIFLMFNICNMRKEATTQTTLANYVRNIIANIKHKILSFELDDANIEQNMAEGTLRIVIEKERV